MMYHLLGRVLAATTFVLWWAVMVWFTHTVWYKTHDSYLKEKEQEQRKELSKGWTPRSIPLCDKELWLRITEGCKNGKS